VSLLVLGGAAWLRFGLVGALLLSLVTLFVRISAEVVAHPPVTVGG
jgi:hypothetical protein